MKNLNIVLLQPQIPQNTGNIARTCAVTGAKLHLVKPFGFEITDKNLKNVYSEINYPDNAFIIFGREDKGIDEDILYKNEEYCVRIPMRNNLRSLNLSNSAAIAVYEVLRQWEFPDLAKEGNLTKYSW